MVGEIQEHSCLTDVVFRTGEFSKGDLPSVSAHRFWLAGLVCVVLATIFFIPPAMAGSAVLTHRYSFDSDARDSVGGADGVLLGAASIANGALVLDGTNSSVQLSNDLFATYDSISFEVWYADVSGSGPSNQLYHFSGSGGEMSYSLGGQASHVVGTLNNAVSLPVPAVGGTNHLIWVEDAAAQTGRIYVNGMKVASSGGFSNTPAMIGTTTTNLLGAGATNSAGSNFKGGILEFRTYQGALSDLDAAVLDASGPELAQTDPGTLQGVRLKIPSPTGPGAVWRAGVFADFSNVTNVNISAQSDLSLTSDNTNVIAVGADQRLRTLRAGTANITAVWQGVSNSLNVAVEAPQDIALIHRYSFNEPTNDWIVHDSVGVAHGRLFNTGTHAPTNGVFTGHGEMSLAGGYFNIGSSGGYAVLPPGMISCLSEVTIEAWVTWTPPKTLPMTYGNGAWQRIFDFGSPSTKSYLFLTPATDNVSFTTKSLLHTAITTNMNYSETPRLNWTNMLPTNVLSQVAVVYSPARGVMKMYLNGAPVASGTATLPLAGIDDTNCWLGKSLFSPDAYFYGKFSEFRVYSGALADVDVAADYEAGPDIVGADFVLHGFRAAGAAGTGMNLTWGPSATNLVLQASSDFGSTAVWDQVSLTPTLQNGRYTVSVPFSNAAAFFRLHAP
jgi:hypothetical protein